MPDVLIVYASSEGQTARIAEFLGSRLSAQGLSPTVSDVAHLPPALDLESFAGILVAASIHRAHHQAAIEDFVRRHAAQLGTRHSGFVSVSLSAAGGTEDLAVARTMADDFLAGTAWRPRFVHLAAGAFRYTQYGFLKRWVLRRIAEAKGAPTDTSQDHELTDWEALGRFADRFGAVLISGPALRRV